jgi:phage host-nuclease inhibitor protein Gam
VDGCLKDITERQRRVDAAKASAAAKITAINEKLEQEIGTDVALITRAETDIAAYTVAHQDQLTGRSKQLTHGVVRLRAVTELKPLTKWTWAKVLDRLKELKRMDLIRIKEEVNKEAIIDAKMDPTKMETIGVRHVTSDSFSYELTEARTAST